jgi:hypothetical protein
MGHDRQVVNRQDRLAAMGEWDQAVRAVEDIYSGLADSEWCLKLQPVGVGSQASPRRVFRAWDRHVTSHPDWNYRDFGRVAQQSREQRSNVNTNPSRVGPERADIERDPHRLWQARIDVW